MVMMLGTKASPLVAAAMRVEEVLVGALPRDGALLRDGALPRDGGQGEVRVEEVLVAG